MPSTPPSGKFIATFFRPSYGTMVVKLVGMIISLGGLASSTINHHQPSTINHHQPSSTIINHHQPSSTIINHHQPSSTIINHQPLHFYEKRPNFPTTINPSTLAGGLHPPPATWQTASCPEVGGFLNKKIRKPMKVGRNTPEKEELFPMTGIIEFTYFFVEMYI